MTVMLGSKSFSATRFRPLKDPHGSGLSMSTESLLRFVITYGDKVVLGIAAQPLAHGLGLSASQIGLAGSVFFLAFTVGGFLVGCVDEWRAVCWTLLLIVLVLAASVVPLIVAATFVLLLVVGFVLGPAAGVGPCASRYHLTLVSGEKSSSRDFLLSLILFCTFILAPTLALLAAVFGWCFAFAAMGTIGTMWCSLWLLVGKKVPYAAVRKTWDTSELVLGTGTEVTALATCPPADRVGVKRVRTLASATFIGNATVACAIYTLVAGLMTWLPSYFEVGLGYSGLQTGGLLGILGVVSLVAMFASGLLSARLMNLGVSGRIVRGILPGIALLLCGLALVAVPHLRTTAVAVAVVCLGFGVGMITFEVPHGGEPQLCPLSQRTDTLGPYMALIFIGGMVAPYLIGRLVDSVSTAAAGYALSFQVFGVVAVAGAVGVLLAIEPEGDRPWLVAETGATSDPERASH